MAEITAALSEAAPRTHRSRNDGVQERSHGSQRRSWRKRKSFCASAVLRPPARSRRAPRSRALIGTYIHAGAQLGVMVEVNCESDFVARTDDFQELVRDIAMHIAAADPQFIRKEDVTPAALEKEKEIQRARAINEGKPEKWPTRSWKAAWRSSTKRSALRAALRQGKHDHHRPADQNEDRETGRKHLGFPVRALQSRRRASDQPEAAA